MTSTSEARRASLTEEEIALIQTLNPAERTEATRRLKAKAQAYLRRAELLAAWAQEKGRAQ
jgi:hypothetical protein